MNLPKPISGFYENLPEAQIKEQKYKDIIQSSYMLSGFTFIDTPAIERVETLLSKGSDDNEIYGVKRLKSDGNDAFEMGLRFDLTVPLARYIAQHQGQLSFPIKTQQIGKSWRGERAQKGRYREFYQADIDIIGSEKIPLFADVEVVSTLYRTLHKLDFGAFMIHINNRKILFGFLESLGIENISEVVSIIDKKDKVETIAPLLEKIGMNSIHIENIMKLLSFSERHHGLEVLSFFDGIENATLDEGIQELTYLYRKLLIFGVPDNTIKINPAISRGLNYYTGLVFETFIVGKESLGSISSGGRYENLCSNFTAHSFPGVGGSIGVSRLLSLVSDDKDLENDKKTICDILILNTGEEYISKNIEIVESLRSIGVSTELYLDGEVKFSKQLKYANNKNIPYVIICGEEEFSSYEVQIKNMMNGTQEKVSWNNIQKYFQDIF